MTNEEVKKALTEIATKVNELNSSPGSVANLEYYYGFNHGLKMAMLIFDKSDNSRGRNV